jgi:hypothetical protein
LKVSLGILELLWNPETTLGCLQAQENAIEERGFMHGDAQKIRLVSSGALSWTVSQGFYGVSLL